MPAALEQLKARYADLNALHSAIAMMDWDQQTLMPNGGAEARAEHMGSLSKLLHEMYVADETRRLVEEAKPGASGEDADMLRVLTRDLDLMTKLPTSLVAEKTKLSAV